MKEKEKRNQRERKKEIQWVHGEAKVQNQESKILMLSLTRLLE